MASIKVLKKIQQSNNEKRSLVKELIALRPISPLVTRKTNPLKTIYEDTNAPPIPIDQFAPYLTRKLEIKRNQQIEKMKSKKQQTQPSFIVTNSLEQKDNQHEDRQLINNNEQDILTKSEELQDQKTDKASQSQSLQSHLIMEQTFDKIASGSSSIPLNRLMESTLQIFFSAERVFFYHDISSVKILYCPSTTQYCPHGTGLVGYSQFTRKTVNLEKANNHAAYSLQLEGNQCPPNSRVLIFPLFDSTSNIRSVVEVVRNSESPVFTTDDIKFVEYLQNKCQMYSRWLFQPILDDSLASDLLQTSRLQPFIESIREKLTQMFGCRGAELWSYDCQTEIMKRYNPKSDTPDTVSPSESGITGFSLRQQIPVSCVQTRVHSAYQPKTDGCGDHSILVIPVKDPGNPLIYALVLRGKRIPHFFTDHDEKILCRVAPYIICALNSAELIEKNHQALKASMHQQKRLKSLLDVAEALSGELQMDILIPNIMQRAKELVKSDRCSLFMVNETKDKLVTSFQGGLSNSIEIPLNKGIVGFTATTGEILNIEDAYEDSRFNRATDLATGYRTLTLLCVPIFDDKHEIRGVTEMINKVDGVFTKEDEKLIQIFNVFCGISLENARLYHASIELSLQLRSFFDISTSLAQPQTMKKMMEDILKNIRKVFGAVKSFLFLIDNSGISFSPFVQDEDIEAKLKKVQQKNKEESENDSFGVKKVIIQKLMIGQKTEKDAEAEEEEELRNKFIEFAITNKESVLENDQKKPERSLIISPILSSDRTVMGAVAVQWKKTLKKFSFDDKKILESYAVYLSLSLERSKLKNAASLGTMEVEMQNWISSEERSDFQIPVKFRMKETERYSTLLTINFNIFSYRSNNLYGVVFNLFDIFKLNSKFKITAQSLFTFLYEIKKNYNPVPHHNWEHAVDTIQFLAYEIYYGKLLPVFTPFDILTMFTACICHDVNHDGFSTSYSEKAKFPLDILFNNQSVPETNHCSVAISILTKNESNIFSNFTDAKMNKMWPVFIELILATDMAKHFEILENAMKFIESDKSWKDSKEGKLTIMKILIKAADLAASVRPFSVADKSAKDVCEEFFRQGDIKKCDEFVFIDGIKDRDHLDKDKSTIPFYKQVALPCLQTLGKAVPSLSTTVQHLQLNISKWEEKQKIEEARKEEEEEKNKKENEDINDSVQANENNNNNSLHNEQQEEKTGKVDKASGKET